MRRMLSFDCKKNNNWLSLALEGLTYEGYAVIEGVLDDAFVQATREKMYMVQERILSDLGRARLERAGERGVLRLMMQYDPHFVKFLEIPELLSVIDSVVSDTCILHLQNGFILPSSQEAPSDVFQYHFHRDFRRVLNGYPASVNAMFTIDRFTRENGGTLIVSGTHQQLQAPSLDYMNSASITIECGPGSMILFDSTLMHTAGFNISGADRLSINHQFTRSYFKQQIDYVRALEEGFIQAQVPRTQQLLGWYTRVVTSLDEYYRPADQRMYRAGQG